MVAYQARTDVLGFKDHARLESLKVDSDNLLKLEIGLLWTAEEFKYRAAAIEKI